MAKSFFILILFYGLAGFGDFCPAELLRMGDNKQSQYESEVLSAMIHEFKSTGTGLLSQNNPEIHFPNRTCGYVCALNVIQSIKKFAGMEVSENPAKELNALVKVPLQHGPNSIDLGEILKTLVRTKLPTLDTSVDILSLDEFLPEIVDRRSNRITKTLEISAIGSQSGSIQIITYIVLQNSKLVGGHSVILFSKTGRVIAVIDPNFPEKPVTYVAQPHDLKGGLKTVELLPANPKMRDTVYGPEGTILIHSVMTVKLY